MANEWNWTQGQPSYKLSDPQSALNNFLAGIGSDSGQVIKIQDQKEQNPLNFFEEKSDYVGDPSVVPKTEVYPSGSSGDLFSDATAAVNQAQELEEEYAHQGNIANKDYFDYTYRKSEEAADKAYNRSLDYVENYYSRLVEGLRKAGLNTNLALAGGAGVSVPSYMASGSSLSAKTPNVIYDNLFMKLLIEQMSESNDLIEAGMKAGASVVGSILGLF